eukprot:TRINITY_DN50174_c0_g1_i1.p1 TRINITY_DN50174_c0_g1~~TRINITY_DN50174_c0_g1_i1.p1  ORF type:complete len:255 (+),score=70.43 TRINITY_DN50174_c0_g1_i1:91-855(+)
MKVRFGISCLLLLTPLTLVPIAAGEEQDEDLDLDLEDLETDDDDGEEPDPDPAFGGAPVEDFDLDMPEPQRVRRMQTCLTALQFRMQKQPELLTQFADQLVQSRPEIGKEQAMNSVFFTWLMSCYMKVTDADLNEFSSSKSMDEKVFEPSSDMPQTPQTASKRQWELLEAVMKEQQQFLEQKQQQRAQQQQQPGKQAPPPTEEVSSGPGSKLFSVLALAGVFGALGIATMFLVSKEKAAANRSGKKDKKGKKKA